VKKGIYIDGHEREDVVAYRKEFLARMAYRLQCKVQYDIDDEGNLVEIPLDFGDSNTRLVFVYHDESCFNANDGLRSMWLEENEHVLQKKGAGKCIMISGFLCSCHGLFSTVTITPGKNSDGYWTCEDLARQAKDALEKFDELHPDSIGVFIFDNSMNHKKAPPDGLYAANLPLKDGGKNVSLNIRNGWFMNANNCQVQQPMQHNGVAKGLATILDERGLFKSKLRRQCTTNCKLEEPFDCCCVNLLAHQPDFAAQKSMLEELFSETKHDLDMLPKFHPEFNPIELCWGEMKRYCRKNCNYSFVSLQKVVPESMAAIVPDKFKNFERLCIRYMDAYRHGLPPHLAEYAVKKYKSHRMIPSECSLNALEAEFNSKKK
jgi:hypothetical protein